MHVKGDRLKTSMPLGLKPICHLCQSMQTHVGSKSILSLCGGHPRFICFWIGDWQRLVILFLDSRGWFWVQICINHNNSLLTGEPRTNLWILCLETSAIHHQLNLLNVRCLQLSDSMWKILHWEFCVKNYSHRLKTNGKGESGRGSMRALTSGAWSGEQTVWDVTGTP